MSYLGGGGTKLFLGHIDGENVPVLVSFLSLSLCLSLTLLLSLTPLFFVCHPATGDRQDLALSSPGGVAIIAQTPFNLFTHDSSRRL